MRYQQLLVILAVTALIGPLAGCKGSGGYSEPTGESQISAKEPSDTSGEMSQAETSPAGEQEAVAESSPRE